MMLVIHDQLRFHEPMVLKQIMAYTTELPRMGSTADAQFPTAGIVRGPLEYRTAL